MGFIITLEILLKRNILDLIFISTNCENTLICILQNVMLFTKHIVCLWHINKNIFTNYKPLLKIEKIWQKFYSDCYRVLYSITKPIFDKK